MESSNHPILDSRAVDLGSRAFRQASGRRLSRVGGFVAMLGLALVAFGVPLCAGAQNAEDYFHGGAKSYIHGQKDKAKEEVSNGLKQFPEDVKLNAMAVLLQKPEEKKQQQQQQQDQQQQKEQSQEKQQSQSKPSDSKEQQEKKDQQQAEQQPKPQDQDKSDQAKEEKKQEEKGQPSPSASQQSGKPDDKSDDKSQEQGQGIPGQMSPEQAQQLLDAQKGQEKMLPAKPEAKSSSSRRPLRDW
jgi:hypothetical protein